MKKILFLCLVAACSTAKSEPKHVEPEKKESARNFATESVLKVEENAKCVDQYMGDGPNKTYSTLCTLPNKVIVACSTDTTSGFRCAPLNGQAQQPSQPDGEAHLTKDAPAVQPKPKK